jgi:2-polyprenyl-3-methyl-5-hydroxy-6-metoxy-1,4-benzoquinol methylase
MDNYYQNMLDVEDLDPTLQEPSGDWLLNETQESLLRWLFKRQNLDVVEYLVHRDVFIKSIAEKLKYALTAKELVYKSVPGIVDDEKMRMSPRKLAEHELVNWRASAKKHIRQLLAVEYPVRRDWLKRKIGHQNSSQVVDFYRKTDSYIWELMAANNIVETLYNYGLTLEKMKRLGIQQFLDYGAGIGTFVIAGHEQGLKTVHMDLPSQTSKFAKWRYGIRGMKIQMIEAKGDHTDIPNANTILCTEVVEHVPDPLSLLDSFANAIPKRGYLVVSESCKETGKFISHLPANEWLGGERFDQELNRRGFFEVLAKPAVKPRIFCKRK